MVATALLRHGADAQVGQDDRRIIPPRSIELTAQQEYVIRENLKDLRLAAVSPATDVRIGEKLPPGIETHEFPSLVVEKVPKVKNYKFFITENQIVVVGPQQDIADTIKLAK